MIKYPRIILEMSCCDQISQNCPRDVLHVIKYPRIVLEMSCCARIVLEMSCCDQVSQNCPRDVLHVIIEMSCCDQNVLMLVLLLMQEVYHTTHQCFYSKRSMYLALFRLIDGEKGIEELEPWLRNVQVVLYKKA